VAVRRAAPALRDLQSDGRLWEHGGGRNENPISEFWGQLETADVCGAAFISRSPLPGRCRCGVPDIRFSIEP
jgi:hypothetical protein